MTALARSPKTVLVLVIGLVLATAVGACGRDVRSEPDGPVQFIVPVGPAGDAVQVTAAPVGPTGERHGAPIGWRHDAVGATAAASAYVAASGRLARLGPLARRDMVLALATDSYGETLAASVNSQLDDLLFALGERGVTGDGLVFVEYPLATRSDSDGADRARVQVWSVLVVATKSGAVPRQVWRTATLTMVWSNGDWKVDRWDTTTGPTPAPPPEVQVSDAATVASVAGWTPTAGGS